MTKEEFLKAMTFLGTAYNKEFTPDQVGVWYGFFETDNFDKFKGAIAALIPTSKFLPSIADLKSAMADHDLAELTADQAWDQVLTAIRKYGFYRSEEAMASLPELTQRAVKNLGGFQAICQSESGEWLRKDFASVYNSFNGDNVKHYVTGDKITIADILAHQKAIAKKDEYEEDIVF